MNKTLTAVATAALVLGTSATLAAQGTEIAAFYGIQSTPLGALPPVLAHSSAKRMGFHGQYGYLGLEGREAVNSFGGGVTLPFRGDHVSLTAALSQHTCPEPIECKGGMMVGANWHRTVAGVALGTGSERAILRIGVDAGLGYGRPDNVEDADESAWSAGIGMPISVTSMGSGVQVTPFITPRFAIGRYRVENDLNDTGSSLMLGGGLGITGLLPNIGFNVGFQKAFIEGAPTQYGIGFTYR
jgi:hypothetical protein